MGSRFRVSVMIRSRRIRVAFAVLATGAVCALVIVWWRSKPTPLSPEAQTIVDGLRRRWSMIQSSSGTMVRRTQFTDAAKAAYDAYGFRARREVPKTITWSRQGVPVLQERQMEPGSYPYEYRFGFAYGESFLPDYVEAYHGHRKSKLKATVVSPEPAESLGLVGLRIDALREVSPTRGFVTVSTQPAHERVRHCNTQQMLVTPGLGTLQRELLWRVADVRLEVGRSLFFRVSGLARRNGRAG